MVQWSRRNWTRRAVVASLGLAVGGFALGAKAQQPAAPAGQTPAQTPAPAAQAPGGEPPKDLSRDGTSRRDTQVVRPKDGETVSVRLPKQGQAMVVSQLAWAVTGGKEGPELFIEYDVRGIRVVHTGTGQGKATFNLRLIDGRNITVNVRTANAKYPVGYLVII